MVKTLGLMVALALLVSCAKQKALDCDSNEMPNSICVQMADGLILIGNNTFVGSPGWELLSPLDAGGHAVIP